jgi:hypothetical protein
LDLQPKLGVRCAVRAHDLHGVVDGDLATGHRDSAEDEALAKEKHYRLIPIPLNA